MVIYQKLIYYFQLMKNLKMRKGKILQENNKHKYKSQNNSDSEISETEAGSSKEIVFNKILLKDISDTLSSIISKNNKNKKDNYIFNRDYEPKISIYDYLLRIQKYSGIEDSTLITSLIYIDRICSKKGIILTNHNIHRLLFSSILVAIKYNEDIIYDNSFYSKIAGVTVSELKKLEYEFLKIIDFKLFVLDNLYQKYFQYLNMDENDTNV